MADLVRSETLELDGDCADRVPADLEADLLKFGFGSEMPIVAMSAFLAGGPESSQTVYGQLQASRLPALSVGKME